MNDKVFGELVFNNGWEKKLDCDFWGQESVKIRVSAYKMKSRMIISEMRIVVLKKI